MFQNLLLTKKIDTILAHFPNNSLTYLAVANKCHKGRDSSRWPSKLTFSQACTPTQCIGPISVSVPKKQRKMRQMCKVFPGLWSKGGKKRWANIVSLKLAQMCVGLRLVCIGPVWFSKLLQKQKNIQKNFESKTEGTFLHTWNLQCHTLGLQFACIWHY